MKLAQKARQHIKGHWVMAATVQCTIITAALLVLFTELMTLRITGLGAERVIHASALWSGSWLYAVIMIVILLLDWLIVSPLLLGKAAFYWYMANKGDSSIHIFFSFFRQHYSWALRWRFSLFWRRLLWGLLCCIPAALTMGYAEVVRRNGANTPAADVTLLFCTIFGLILLLVGAIATELLMLRYFPAAFLLVINFDQKLPKKLFRYSCTIMRTHIIEVVWLYMGFIGWLASCVFIFPYFYAAPLFQTSRALAVRRYIDDYKEYNR